MMHYISNAIGGVIILFMAWVILHAMSGGGFKFDGR